MKCTLDRVYTEWLLKNRCVRVKLILTAGERHWHTGGLSFSFFSWNSRIINFKKLHKWLIRVNILVSWKIFHIRDIWENLSKLKMMPDYPHAGLRLDPTKKPGPFPTDQHPSHQVRWTREETTTVVNQVVAVNQTAVKITKEIMGKNQNNQIEHIYWIDQTDQTINHREITNGESYLMSHIKWVI